MLETKRHKVARIHSGRTQGQRQEALEGFRRNHYQILIATDIAARGIDVRNISHVINYDIPNNADDYIHRIGRTARATATGLAYSFITPDEEDQVRSIERTLRRKLNRIRLDDFAYDAPPQPKTGSRPDSNAIVERRAFRAAPAAGPARVFDRFAHSGNSRHPSAGQKPRAGFGAGKPRSGRGDRQEFRGRSSSWSEGSMGAPSSEEQAELKRLQRKLFGSGRTRHRHVLS
jgi:ATP-dependent RNA helicase RhlE